MGRPEPGQLRPVGLTRRKTECRPDEPEQVPALQETKEDTIPSMGELESESPGGSSGRAHRRGGEPMAVPVGPLTLRCVATRTWRPPAHRMQARRQYDRGGVEIRKRLRKGGAVEESVAGKLFPLLAAR